MFRPIKIRQYLGLMKSKGHDAEAVLASSGVTAALLADPDCLIGLLQAKTIVANMIALSGDQGIGLEAGGKTELIDFGVVGYLMMSAPCAREAIQYWINYSNSLLGMMVELRLEERAPDDWSLLITETAPLGFIYNFCVEEILVMACRYAGILTATQPAIRQLDLSYPAPVHHALYARHFDAPIRFNAPHTRISFTHPRLDQPLRGNDRELNELCARQCELLRRRIGSESPCAAKIRDILLRLRGHTPSIEVVAAKLKVSPRTLRRHLHEEGLSYQQLLSEFRAEMAKEYLRSAAMAPKEIAYLLGFKDANSFRRAFKAWTGSTVQEYRMRNTGGGPN